MVKYILVCGGVISGIGKGVIGASPSSSAHESSSQKHSTHTLPSHLQRRSPRSAHEPYSTVHSPVNLSRAPSTRPSGRQTQSTSPCHPHGNDSSPQRDITKLPTPHELFDILTSIVEHDEYSTDMLSPLSPSSVWSFLTDSDYRHPLLTRPAPPSCQSIASSTGLLLKTAGLKVTAIKIDPYMNIDAGTMAPTEHGEVYVLNDGGETDLDLGNYERYLNISLNKDNNVTTGKVYQHVIEKERKGDYLGKTVQIVPHLTNAVQDWIERVSKVPVDETGEEPDVCIVELGGTVGDIESAPFIEAMRQFQFRVGAENFALIYVSLIPVVGGEQKTKPTQAGVRDLRGLGLLPDLIACRCEHPLLTATMEKVSMFCHVTPKQVMGVHNVSSTYHVPLLLRDQGLLEYLTKRLNLSDVKITADMKRSGDHLMDKWRTLTTNQERMFESVSIVLVGKYTSLQDSYMSVVKALEHASMRCGRKLILEWVDSSDLEPQAQVSDPVRFHDAWRALCSAKGIIVPGGFGQRGTEGMIAAVKWAREQKVPFLGICLGFQVAVIEWARNICGLKQANSAELDSTAPDQVICFMPEISKTQMGGTMRLGLRPTVFEPKTEDSKLRRLYGSKEVAWERHRHRYEVEPKYVDELEANGGLRFIGKDERGERMQMLELEEHPYFVALQAHPELCSRPLNPSPPFLGLVAAACGLDELGIQLSKNEKEYVAPHPESAKVVPASEAVTERAKGKKQGVSGVRVRGEVADENIDKVEETLNKVHLRDDLPNGTTA